MSSTLSAHSPKFNSQLVTLDALRNVPAPMALGARHKPVPHAVLVDAIRGEIANRGYQPTREQYALGKKGAALFGVIDIEPIKVETLDMVVPNVADRGMSFGFRNATDRSMAIKAVRSGSRVFVCDNLSLSGSMFSMERKNTTHLDLHDAVARGFDKFSVHINVLNVEIARLQDDPLSDIEAKSFAYDIFASGVVPIRLFDDVERFYFRPGDEMTDCQPRTKYGLHNAFTRALKDLSPQRLFSATVALGREFGMQA